MGKFDGILICTDLDGTLLRGDKTISEENRNAIEYFKSEGGYFTFITGRMPYYSMNAYRDVKPNVPFGCINGGGVYDGKSGEYVWRCPLSRDALKLVEMIDEKFAEVGIQICTFERTYFSKDNGVNVRFRRETGLPNIFSPYMEIDEQIGKIIFATDDEAEIQAVERALREHTDAQRYDFVRSERSLFEILPKGVKKSMALEKLCEHLQVKRERSVAVGDYYNDISMFAAAGLGIAVANACPDAIAAADTVTVSNEEHAIARIISDIESGVYTL